ncbi:MAG: hypothetical protein PVH50_07910, partial [Anaerolineae bacterium]
DPAAVSVRGVIPRVKFDVSEKTRQETEKCWRSFACLARDGHHICQVRDCVGQVLFVERNAQTYCPYDVTFGYSHICSCPVRREIYERYGE